MTCIIVDDEPLARKAIQILAKECSALEVLEVCANASLAADFLRNNSVDLIFLDIKMPGISGIEFARTISRETLVIFTTAFVEFAVEGFEVDAIDYLIKPVKTERFQKAVNKAIAYQHLLTSENVNTKIEFTGKEYFFVKSERKFVKINFSDILFIEGLKDYVVIQLADQKIITAMNIKTIHDQLPQTVFVRVSKSYIINAQKITSFDNNSILIKEYEIPIGNMYRKYFFNEFVTNKLMGR